MVGQVEVFGQSKKHEVEEGLFAWFAVLASLSKLRPEASASPTDFLFLFFLSGSSSAKNLIELLRSRSIYFISVRPSYGNTYKNNTYILLNFPQELYRYAATTPPQPPALSLSVAIARLPSSTMFVVLFVLVP